MWISNNNALGSVCFLLPYSMHHLAELARSSLWLDYWKYFGFVIPVGFLFCILELPADRLKCEFHFQCNEISCGKFMKYRKASLRYFFVNVHKIEWNDSFSGCSKESDLTSNFLLLLATGILKTSSLHCSAQRGQKVYKYNFVTIPAIWVEWWVFFCGHLWCNLMRKS